MGLFMHKNGFYYVNIQRDGKRIQFSTKTRDPELAKEMYREFLKEFVLAGVSGKLTQKNSTISYTYQLLERSENVLPAVPIQKIYEDYLKHDELVGVSDNTLYVKKRLLKFFNETKIEYVQDFNQEKLDQFQKYLHEITKSKDSIMKYISKTKAFLHYMIKKGYFLRVEYDKLDFVSYKTKIRDTYILPEDWQQILNYLHEKNDVDFEIYLKTLYHTCSRPGEIYKMIPKHIDTKNNCIIIEQPKIAKKVSRSTKFAYILNP